jgi:predicted GIY-YIG superfamily endonuclease
MKPQLKSNIYQITCECGAIYNGETKVGLKTRMTQHEKKRLKMMMKIQILK